MNVVMTGDGRFVEVQGTAEGEPFDRALLDRAARPRRRRLRRAHRDPGEALGADPACQRWSSPRRNAHKVDELRRILADAGPGDRRCSAVADFDAVPEVRRDRRHLRRERAAQGARGARRRPGCPPSPTTPGSASTSLGGMPGVFSARWSGRHGDDRANLELVLAQLADVPDEHRAASFVCAAALAAAGRRPSVVVRGPLAGPAGPRAARRPTASATTRSSCPTASERTSAELSDAEKDAISHRGRALRERCSPCDRRRSAAAALAGGRVAEGGFRLPVQQAEQDRWRAGGPRRRPRTRGPSARGGRDLASPAPPRCDASAASDGPPASR